MSEKELVDHPDHYGGRDDPYEHVKVAEALGWDRDAMIYNCTKYIWRCGRKEGAPTLRDLKKAAWYLNRKIQRLEKAELPVFNGKMTGLTPETGYNGAPDHAIEVPDRTVWPLGRAPIFGEQMQWKGHTFVWCIESGGLGTSWMLVTGEHERRVPRKDRADAGQEWTTARMP